MMFLVMIMSYDMIEWKMMAKCLSLLQMSMEMQFNHYKFGKNQKGIETKVVSVDDVGQTPEIIKSYILNEYIYNDLTFVLLVGNTDDVPTFWSNDGNNPSDPMYGYLDGDDAYPEVFIGRFSAISIEDIETKYNAY